MELSKASAIYAAPIPLRIILAITFIWAGFGKVIHQVPIQGEQAALLANMGYSFQPPAGSADPSLDQPEIQTPNEVPPTQEMNNSDEDQDDQANQADQTTQTLAPLVSLASLQTASTPTIPSADTQDIDDQASNAQQQAQSQPRYTAADFPEPMLVRSLYNLAVLTYSAAHPAPNADGSVPPPVWPEWAARDHWPITMAWVASLVEITAGLLVLIGLLTRLSAVALAGMMATAAWLTQFGAAIQSGDTALGFLPTHGVWDIYAWQPLLWQLSLLGAAIGLALAGPGALALDRVPHDSDEDDDDEDLDDE